MIAQMSAGTAAVWLLVLAGLLALAFYFCARALRELRIDGLRAERDHLMTQYLDACQDRDLTEAVRIQRKLDAVTEELEGLLGGPGFLG